MPDDPHTPPQLVAPIEPSPRTSEPPRVSALTWSALTLFVLGALFASFVVMDRQGYLSGWALAAVLGALFVGFIVVDRRGYLSGWALAAVLVWFAAFVLAIGGLARSTRKWPAALMLALSGLGAFGPIIALIVMVVVWNVRH